MRPLAPIKSSTEVAVPRWVGKTVLCARVDRSPRTIDYWMAAGRLPYRKLPSGMVRFRLGDAQQRFGIGGLVEDSTCDLVIVPDRIDATQLAPLHDVSVDTVREWVNQGIVPYIKNRGNKVIFDPVAVEKALERFDVHFPTIEPGGRAEEVEI